MRKTRKKGFTIVELVIVIAVIAILAAVLIPTFTDVIQNARKSSAQSQARNLWVQYTAEQAQAAKDYSTFDGYIEVTVNSTKYYFTVENGQFKADSCNEKKPGDFGEAVNESTWLFYKKATGGTTG